MPFTASHAAAVLPFGRRLSASALVIGAMLPDVPLYLPFGYGDTHSVTAMLTTNLVAGLILFVIWHGFLARPVDWFAPRAIRERLSAAQQPGLRRRLNTPGKVGLVVASLLVGQMTHLFLDLFTHAGTPVTNNVAWFNADVAGHPVYLWLQVIVSAIGLVLIAGWALRWYQAANPHEVDREPSVLGRAAAYTTIGGFAAAAFLLTASALSGASPTHAVYLLLVGTTAAAMTALLIVATVWHVQRVTQ